MKCLDSPHALTFTFRTFQDTMITVNNLALLVDARKGNGNVPGSEADQLYRRALPFTPRGEIP